MPAGTLQAIRRYREGNRIRKNTHRYTQGKAAPVRDPRCGGSLSRVAGPGKTAGPPSCPRRDPGIPECTRRGAGLPGCIKTGNIKTFLGFGEKIMGIRRFRQNGNPDIPLCFHWSFTPDKRTPAVSPRFCKTASTRPPALPGLRQKNSCFPIPAFT